MVTVEPAAEGGQVPDVPLGSRGLSREEERSLWLHRAVAEALRRNPGAVLRQAAVNLDRLAQVHAGAASSELVRRWRQVVADGVDAVHEVLVGEGAAHVELRQSSPFAGVLGQAERDGLLQEFRRRRDAVVETPR